LSVEFQGEMRESVTMQQQPSNKKTIQDEWGTSSRQGYEDRPVYQPRKKAPPRKGSGTLKSFGGLLIVGGICWGTYLVTGGADPAVLWKTGGPVQLCGLGVVVSILGKYVG
jgi:hypothetical protein